MIELFCSPTLGHGHIRCNECDICSSEASAAHVEIHRKHTKSFKDFHLDPSLNESTFSTQFELLA